MKTVTPTPEALTRITAAAFFSIRLLPGTLLNPVSRELPWSL